MEKEELIISVFAVFCTIGLPLLLAMALGKFRHDERMAMIDKGVTLEEPVKKSNRYPALRNGLFMIGLSLGAIVGLYVSPSLPAYSDWADLSVPIMAVLFGGVAFVVYFFVSRAMEMKEKHPDSEQ